MQEFLKFVDLTQLDATMILIAIPLFVLFLKGCDSSLIKPFLDRLNKRDQLTVGAGESSESIIEDAIVIEEQYGRKIAEARAAAIKARNAKVDAAKSEATQLVNTAESDAAAKITAERQKVRQQVETQRQTLLRDVDSLAQGVVDKLSRPRAVSAFLIAITINILLSASQVFAEAAAHGEHAAEHGHSYGYLFWYWVNFLVYITVMYFILRNMVAKGWDARRERIRFALEAGKRSLEEANKRLLEAKSQLSRVDAEIKEIVSGIEREGELLTQKFAADAKERVSEIQKSAAESVGMEAKAQSAQMQREIAELVLARATEMLKKSVTKESDKALRQGALAGVKNLM